jgi:hypothetical protein
LGVFLHREARDSYWFLTGISFDFFSISTRALRIARRAAHGFSKQFW